MMRTKRLVVATILNLVLIGCSSSSIIPDIPPSKLYAISQKHLQNGNFKLAIKELEEFYNRYPFGTYAQQVQLDLIYAYYKNNDLRSLKATIARFIRLNPTHPNIDYVIYMNGLSEIALDNCTLQGFFHIELNPSDRDLIHVRNAYYDFAQLLREYPNSQYAADAQKRLTFLKERLAKYELLVAQFYTKIGAYVAVVNRVESMIENYPNTPETHNALFLMENAYRKLQLISEADKVSKIIAVN